MIENKYFKPPLSIVSFFTWVILFGWFLLGVTNYQEFVSVFSKDKLKMFAIGLIGPAIMVLIPLLIFYYLNTKRSLEKNS